MPKISVVVHRDENFFPRHIEIRKGTRKKPSLTVKQTPSPVGESYSIDFEGRRDALPSFPEIMSIVNAKRLERIGTIDEITLIKHATIDVLTAIRDLSVSAKEYFCNSGFEQDFVNWRRATGNPTIDTQYKSQGEKSAKLDWGATISQSLFIPMNTTWITELAFYMRVTDISIELRVTKHYTDAVTEIQDFTCTNPNIFERKVITLAGASHLNMLVFADRCLGPKTGYLWIDELQQTFINPPF